MKIIGFGGFWLKSIHNVIVLRLLLFVNFRLRGKILHLLTIQYILYRFHFDTSKVFF